MSTYNDVNYRPEPSPGWRATPPPPPSGCGPGYGNRRYCRPSGEPWHPEPRPANGIGTAGFVLSILTTVMWWVPYVGWPLWVLAVVFSAIGLGRKPRGLAIAGLVISVVIPVLMLLGVFALFFSALALAGTGA